ncbi:MAG: acyl-CoA reductase, partial [Mucinivorans sp.]
MKTVVDIFVKLGERLHPFGDDDLSREVVSRACEANHWFTPADICRAVEAIRTEFLQRDKLTEWLAGYALPVAEERRVLIVLAGNIPCVGFFDLLCVVASGHRCVVKFSSKDRVLMEYMIGLLRDIEPAVPIEIYDENARIVFDAVIATGSDNANRYFRAQYVGVKTLLRGSRHSVAVLSGQETDAQKAGLSDDIFTYSGLGCRNVSLLFLPRGYTLSLKQLHAHPKYRHNYLQNKAMLTIEGRPFVDFGDATMVEQTEFPVALSELSCIYYDNMEEVKTWLMAHDNELQCVVAQCLPHCVAFGRAQSPSLTDYPDREDIITFLTS